MTDEQRAAQRERARRWRANNPERAKQHWANYQAQHGEQRNARVRAKRAAQKVDALPEMPRLELCELPQWMRPEARR